MPYYQSQKQTVRGNEIRGLELPIRVGAIDDLESDRQPIDVLQDSGGVQAGGSDRLFQLENDFGLDFGRAVVGQLKLGAVSAGVVDGVVVHMGPHQRLQ